MNIEKPKILIVDDRLENLIVLEKLLNPLEISLYRATSGNKALALTLEHDFMLILLDVQMPGMDGYEVMDLLSSQEHTKFIPVIFITANFVDENHELKGYAYGAVDYLFKPINKQILIGKVKVFLELYTQRVQYQRLNQRFQSILNSAGEGIFGLDWEGYITFVNPAAAQLYGADALNLIGKPLSTMLPKRRLGSSLKQNWYGSDIYQTCHQGKILSKDNEIFIKSNGTEYPVEFKATPLKSMCKEKEGVVIVFSDITLRKSAEKQLSRMALYDHLTDLPNRILFEKNAEKSLARAKRNNHLVAIMFLDLDHFKQVNDTLGHDSGDQLLKCVSLRIHSIVRENDTFARLGGDEFAIILEDISTINDCKQVAEKILNAFRVPFTISNHEIIVEISIGISIYPYGGQNISHLIKNADVAMYQAKNKKHSSYKIDDKSMNYPMKKQFQLEIYLHDAIENNELKLYYQPKVNIRKNLISGLEALLRWHHPKLGIISPDTFIPIAEKMGIMPQIAEWTINTACQDIHNLKKQLISNIRVSINLSSSQITYGDISKKLQYSLQQYQISPHDIEIELTETTMIIYRKQCAETLKNLHDIGVTIAIDDFGTGYSSLNYLKDLPIDVLKIDRTFVNDIEYGENSQVIAKAIIDLAHELKLSVVAEGVETLNQVNLLKSYGCDYIQGFYYSKPKSVDQIINYIRHNSQSVF